MVLLSLPLYFLAVLLWVVLFSLLGWCCFLVRPIGWGCCSPRSLGCCCAPRPEQLGPSLSCVGGASLPSSFSGGLVLLAPSLSCGWCCLILPSLGCCCSSPSLGDVVFFLLAFPFYSYLNLQLKSNCIETLQTQPNYKTCGTLK